MKQHKTTQQNNTHNTLTTTNTVNTTNKKPMIVTNKSHQPTVNPNKRKPKFVLIYSTNHYTVNSTFSIVSKISKVKPGPTCQPSTITTDDTTGDSTVDSTVETIFSTVSIVSPDLASDPSTISTVDSTVNSTADSTVNSTVDSTGDSIVDPINRKHKFVFKLSSKHFQVNPNSIEHKFVNLTIISTKKK